MPGTPFPPLCPNCNTAHYPHTTCPAFTNKEEQRRVEQALQKDADDTAEEARRVWLAEREARRKEKDK